MESSKLTAIGGLPCRSTIPIQDATRTRGVVWHDSAMLCNTTTLCISLIMQVLFNYSRPARADPAKNGRTGATPPFLPLYRHAWRGGVTGGVAPPTLPFLGVAPVRLIPAGRLKKGPQRRRLLAGGRPHEMASSDPAFRGPVRVRLGLHLPASPLARGKPAARASWVRAGDLASMRPHGRLAGLRRAGCLGLSSLTDQPFATVCRPAKSHQRDRELLEPGQAPPAEVQRCAHGPFWVMLEGMRVVIQQQ